MCSGSPITGRDAVGRKGRASSARQIILRREAAHPRLSRNVGRLVHLAFMLRSEKGPRRALAPQDARMSVII
jgi:hypothetical protein